MNKIICIFNNGFEKIVLPNKYFINILSCDNGCLIETKNMEKDIEEINKYTNFEIYKFSIGQKYVTTGFKLSKCKLSTHPEFEYPCIVWSTKSITGDNKRIDIKLENVKDKDIFEILITNKLLG